MVLERGFTPPWRWQVGWGGFSPAGEAKEAGERQEAGRQTFPNLVIWQIGILVRSHVSDSPIS